MAKNKNVITGLHLELLHINWAYKREKEGSKEESMPVSSRQQESPIPMETMHWLTSSWESTVPEVWSERKKQKARESERENNIF